MHPRRVALPTLLTFVVLAGCLGGIGTTPTPDTSATATVTPTSTPPVSETPEPPATRTTDRSSSTTDCPAYVYVDPIEAVPDDATVIPYEDLSAERKTEFETALSDGYAEVEDGGEAYSFWVDRPYVRYEGSVYRAVVAVC